MTLAILVGVFLAILANAYIFRRHWWPSMSYSRPNGVEWGAWAEGRDLEMAEGTGYVAAVGTINEMFVRVEARWTFGPDLSQNKRYGAASNSIPTYTTTTKILVKPRVQLPLGIVVLRGRGLDGLADRLISGADIIIDDEPIDSNFIIRGEQPDDIARLLKTPDVRNALCGCLSLPGDFHFSNSEVSISVAEYLTNTDEIDRVLDQLMALVTALRAVCPKEVRGVPEMTPIPVSQTRHLNSVMKRLASLGPLEAVRAIPTMRSMLCSFELKVVRVFQEQGGNYIEGVFVEWGNTVTARIRSRLTSTPKKGEFWSFQGYITEYDPRTNRIVVEVEDAPQRSNRK